MKVDTLQNKQSATNEQETVDCGFLQSAEAPIPIRIRLPAASAKTFRVTK